MRTGKPTVGEWLTNLGPACALYPLIGKAAGFGYILLSVFWGLLATTCIVIGYRLLVRNTTQVDASREMQPTFEKLSWMFLAALLLLAAINQFNAAFYGQGVYFISSNSPQTCLGWLKLHLSDIASLSFGVWLVGGLLFIPLTANVLESTRQRQGFVRIVKSVWLPTLLIGMALSVWVIFTHFPRADYLPLKDTYVCPGEEPPPAAPVPTDGAALLSVLGLLLFSYGYLVKHRTLVELYEAGRLERRRTGPVIQDGNASIAQNREAASMALSRNLRLLVLNAVVLPPIIVGIAMASESITLPTSIIYGVFIFSGFAVWSLAVQIARDKSTIIGLGIIAMQFFYSFLVTVLWVSLLLWLKFHLPNAASQDFFAKALKFALGAIFIQVVFGPVYVKTWGNALSEKWASASADYFIFAIVVVAGLAALPQPLGHEDQFPYAELKNQALMLVIQVPYPVIKVIAVLIVLLGFVFGPAIILRRSLSAYVLIRVLPGQTERVMQSLGSRDVAATVVYGEYDVIAKLEVQGRSTLFSRDTPDDGEELAELAATVKNSIRNVDGIVETHTLLDFSGFVEPPRDDPQSNVSEQV
jgi:hypothetical protein